MIVVWTPYKTNRLKYTFDYIFNTLLKLKYSITTNRSDYETFSGFKFSYSSAPPAKNEPWIWAHNLLFEQDIKDIHIDIHQHSVYHKIFFTHHYSESLIPFDLFAATFYLLSRYEEYLPNNTDKHQRFSYINSIAYKHNFLQLPIINIWAEAFCKQIHNSLSITNHKTNKLNIIPTFDIDNFFAFKGKPFLRSLLGTLHAIQHKRFDLLSLRLAYIFGKISDPYDTYSYIKLTCDKYTLTPIFFILSGKTSSFDTNLHPTHHLFIKTTKQLGEWATIGLHLSYYSLEKKTAAVEKQSLENILQKNITHNRFHFLRFNLPDSYVELIKYGITADFSMGYADIDGFRASTCVPFQFYNLKEETITPLTIYPFAFMDKVILKLSNNESLLQQTIEKYISLYSQFNGTFVLLWHNETLQNNRYGNLSVKAFEYLLSKATHAI
ncbi:MAG: hypothetical protein N2449_02540 [Bacteroidales bacterium]|nr:hypothetical protein [Bacteroidales bacterium]